MLACSSMFLVNHLASLGPVCMPIINSKESEDDRFHLEASKQTQLLRIVLQVSCFHSLKMKSKNFEFSIKKNYSIQNEFSSTLKVWWCNLVP